MEQKANVYWRISIYILIFTIILFLFCLAVNIPRGGIYSFSAQCILVPIAFIFSLLSYKIKKSFKSILMMILPLLSFLIVPAYWFIGTLLFGP
ncbi:hypothetical protein [Paenibacillus sp. KN14-4R]|uniref:hypothetical protein n=1 Tax=Paenibacillus sp. KN14-4R TaxID=3445773 RepID=UPI003F9F89D6